MPTQSKGRKGDRSQQTAFRVRLVTGIVLAICIIAPLISWRFGAINAYDAPTLEITMRICVGITLVTAFFSLPYGFAGRKHVWLVFLTAIAFIVPCALVLLVLLPENTRTAQHLQELSTVMQPVVARVESSQFKVSIGNDPPQWPPVLLDCDLRDDDTPVLNSVVFARDPNLYFPDWGWTIRDPLYFPTPPPIPKSVVLIATRRDQTGTFRLDDGNSIPGFTEVAIIFILNLDRMEVVWKSEKLFGGEPSLSPIRGPGGGVTYLSSISGSPVDASVISEVIREKVPWRK